ncbi:hypothetical protein F2P81_000185 [Scophthalmus maximus]|uniref:Uncharacterized protein n=1 Tax=Scophthalmus maximus TaxID=52904 RepID=A0A6A4TWX6_SCOMX|nr:hypothetical protein F2P81_000185 [Scophthalmus maximus]
MYRDLATLTHELHLLKIIGRFETRPSEEQMTYSTRLQNELQGDQQCGYPSLQTDHKSHQAAPSLVGLGGNRDLDSLSVDVSSVRKWLLCEDSTQVSLLFDACRQKCKAKVSDVVASFSELRLNEECQTADSRWFRVCDLFCVEDIPVTRSKEEQVPTVVNRILWYRMCNGRKDWFSFYSDVKVELLSPNKIHAPSQYTNVRVYTIHTLCSESHIMYMKRG